MARALTKKDQDVNLYTRPAAAQHCFQTAQLSQDGLQQIVCGIFGLLLHFVAGALPAVPASYASHVLLDAATSTQRASAV